MRRPWLGESDLDFYAAEFKRSGFRGPLNYYRNTNRNWELMASFADVKVTVPALFIAGDHDLVVSFPGTDQLLANMKNVVPGAERDQDATRLRSLDPAGAPQRGQRGDHRIPAQPAGLKHRREQLQQETKTGERPSMATSTAAASSSGLYADPREDWLAQYTEEVIDPQRPIVDPHHHLWDRGGQRYMIEEMAADIASGHNIVATVYVDCRSMYRAGGPEAFRPVGEVEFANGVAAMSASGGYGPAQINAGIVSHVNLLLGDGRPSRCWKPKSPPAMAASAASGIPRPGMRSSRSPACMPSGQRASCSTLPFVRVLPVWRR